MVQGKKMFKKITQLTNTLSITKSKMYIHMSFNTVPILFKLI